VVREDLQGGTRRGLLSAFLHKKYIHRCSFYLSGSVNRFLNFCVAYFPYCFLKMAVKNSHSHFVHVAFVSILVFQTFDRMIFGTLTFPGTRWYVMTVMDTQMVRDQKKFENHCSNGTSNNLLTVIQNNRLLIRSAFLSTSLSITISTAINMQKNV